MAPETVILGENTCSPPVPGLYLTLQLHKYKTPAHRAMKFKNILVVLYCSTGEAI